MALSTSAPGSVRRHLAAAAGERCNSTEPHVPVDLGSHSLQIEQEARVIASLVAITERRALERGPALALDERLGWFERLLADLSASVINVPSGQVDGAIKTAQQRSSRHSIWTGALCGLPRTAIWSRATIGPDQGSEPRPGFHVAEVRHVGGET
jgi:hypothetical protein